MVMEPMAEASASMKEGMERRKLREGLKKKGIKRKRDDTEGDETPTSEKVPIPRDEERKKKKVKGLKEPNPLSVKKPKRKMTKIDGNVLAKQDSTEISRSGIDAQEASNDIQDSLARKKRKRKHKSSNPIEG